MKITAILMSYKRKPNMPKIIQSLRDQTIDVDIWLINNNGFEDFEADALIAIPWNAGEMARYIWAARPQTDLVMFQDDDWIMEDKHFLSDAIDIWKETAFFKRNRIICTSGRNINFSGQNKKWGYYWPEARNGAAIAKGHFQLFHREYATKVPIMGHPYASDIWWSMATSKGAPLHYVSGELHKRLKRLPQHGQGLQHRPGQPEERSEVTKACIDHWGVQKYWWNDWKQEGAYELFPEDYK